MPKQFRVGERAGNYVIVEGAGRSAESALYLAMNPADRRLFWLLTSDTPLERLADKLPAFTTLQAGSQPCALFAVTALSAAWLATLVPALDPAFVGWRWAGLAESFGLDHDQGQVYQRSRPFDLSGIYFNESAQAVTRPFALTPGPKMPFPAPEPPGALTPASDVYSLAASLLALLGAGSAADASGAHAAPKGPLASRRKLWQVLRRAVDPDPARRYPDGHALALALNDALPAPRALALDQPAPPAARRPGLLGLFDGLLMTLGPLVVFVALLAGLFVLVKGTNQPAPAWLPALLSWLPGSGGSGPPARPLGTSGPTPTPVPLPAGPLAFDASDLSFSAPCTAHLLVLLSKGGQRLPASAPVEFSVAVNARAVDNPIVVPGSASDPDHFELIFSAQPLCSAGGAVRIGASVAGTSSATALCYFGASDASPQPNAPEARSVSSIQIDPHAYPDLALYFTLADASGAAAHLRGTRTCSLSQDGQPVTDFSLNSVDTLAEPLTVALLLDVSGSMSGEPVKNARLAAAEFVRQLGAGASACVYSFSTVVNRLQACSGDRQAAINALGNLTAGGNTSLYDALLQVGADMANLGGRHAIVLLSDGADTSSRTTLAQALSRLQQSNLPVHAIGLVSSDFDGTTLKQIAATTGGTYLETPSSTDLNKLYLVIQGQLSAQYGLRFKSLFPDRKTGNLLLRLGDAASAIEVNHPFVAP